VRCINCHQRRRCVIVEASVPDVQADRYVVAARLPICRKCLADDIGTLGDYLSKEIR
jgi:hypothetical protein